MERILVTELRQWHYCPRIVYYCRLFGQPAPATAKMREGKLAQETTELLEARRSLRRYGLGEAKRRFGVWLQDHELGLAGKVDMLLEGPGVAAVVDFKLTAEQVRTSHRVQLAAYAILVERQLGLQVPTAFVYRIPDASLIPVPVGPKLRAEVQTTVLQIRELTERQICPEATRHRKKCQDCEYANYCADVW